MSRIERIIAGFGDCTVGVIGDSVADIYILGLPERISREAPVMVVRKEEERFIPGCAANTVNNLIDLGCKVAPVTLVGDDEPGRQLRSYLEARRVRVDGVLFSDEYRTVTKTRIMVGDANRIKHQVIRIDHEPQPRVPPEVEKHVLAAIDRIDPDVDAWLVSDYNYFLVSDLVAERLVDLARGKIVVVDSRFRLGLFEGVRCLTPNESEAESLSGIAIRSDHDAREAGWAIMSRLKTESLALTRGNKGMILFEKSGLMVDIPAVGEEEVVDVSGAGDTVAATLTLALVAGANASEAAKLANCAAGVVVMKSGAATCSVEELRSRLHLIRN
jgi:D-glycero-beta-D-manno-heptose-7-phosphate kinase